MLKKSFLSVLMIATFFASNISLAQLPVPFKVRYQSYVKGDMTVIANNIVNRKDYSGAPNVPYNNATKTAKLNDEFKMYYIDIDKDFSTFSSSAATLNLKNSPNKKIVYAGLYWSATYKYNSGVRKSQNKFKAFDKNREAFDEIKIKLPSYDTYVDIKGEVIFDGINKKGFDESAPYAVYADITYLVKDLEDPTGEYTVANIKATQGEIEGGVSGGWTIFFVYEDETETSKFITSFDGFAGVTDKDTDISFTGFKSLPEGKVIAKLACAGLEGDNNLSGDQLQIKSEFTEKFTLLSNSLKQENNFFNSNIVVEDEFFTLRNPNSKNTLGYDTSLITINNPDNTVIQNNTDEVTLKLKTVGDRYFVFFNAFNIEVQLIENKEDNTIVSNNKINKKPEIKETVIKKEIPTTKETVVSNTSNNKKPLKEISNVDSATERPILSAEIEATNKKVSIAQPTVKPIKAPEVNHPKVKTTVTSKEKPQVNPIAEAKAITNNALLISENLSRVAQQKFGSKPKVTALLGPTVEIDDMDEGYYVVAGVFGVHSNAVRFTAKLRSMGIDANYFINPKNNYRYVYVSKHNNWSSACSLYYSNVEGKYYNDIWIMPINTIGTQITDNTKVILQTKPFCPKQLMVALKVEEELS
ncbi:SPOR domain-containing protein [Flavobacterium sp.]|uniref:SPOR domain-containing protein n=1 Tax=Flavobacterium sp. TaxID=239 RepID=UPI003F697987